MNRRELEPRESASPEAFYPQRSGFEAILPHTFTHESEAGLINKPTEEPLSSESHEISEKKHEKVLFISGEDRREFVEELTDPWEPFNGEPHPSQRFINLYQGPFSDRMELHRDNAERLLQVAGIDGIVTIVDVPRDRSFASAVVTSVNPDGSASGSRFKSAEKEKRVKATNEGWKIEIPGEDILDELSRQDSSENLDKSFVGEINKQLRNLLGETIFFEKLAPRSLEPSGFYFIRVIGTVNSILIPSSLATSIYLNSLDAYIASIATASLFGGNIVSNIMAKIMTGLASQSDDFTVGIEYEDVLPPIKIHRWIRGISFMKGKGRNLVRLKEDQ